MKLKILIAVYQVAIVAAASIAEKQVNGEVLYLEPGSVVDYMPQGEGLFFRSHLRIFCYRGGPKTLRRLFETIELNFESNSDEYVQYEGATPEEVHEHYNEKQSIFSFNLFTQKRSKLQMSPFTERCIGMETQSPYRVRLQQLRVDFARVFQLAAGVALFVYAGYLSHNTLFYYITGIVVGIATSFMLLIWLCSKIVPRRPLMYGMLVGGWAIGIYMAQMIWQNLRVIFVTYRTYVFWYILITGLVSFFICYRLGPPQNQRSKNIVKWLLQLMALLLIYVSSQFEEATAAFIILTAVIHYFPRSWYLKARAWYIARFPPKRRLLTNEEYYEQGVKETTKALEDLRNFANSPDCKTWKVMTKLSDPLRFAEFVEGGSHLRDEEILSFEDSQEVGGDESDVTEDSELEEEQEEIRHRAQIQPTQQFRRGLLPFVSDEEMNEDEDEQDDNENENVNAIISSRMSINRIAPNLRRTPVQGFLQNQDSANSSYPYNTRRQVMPAVSMIRGRSSLQRSYRSINSRENR